MGLEPMTYGLKDNTMCRFQNTQAVALTPNIFYCYRHSKPTVRGFLYAAKCDILWRNVTFLTARKWAPLKLNNNCIVPV